MYLVSLILDLGRVSPHVDIRGFGLLLEAKAVAQNNARQTSFHDMHKGNAQDILGTVLLC